MDAFNIFTFLLCALAVMPVLLVFRIIALESRKRKQLSIIEDYATWAVHDEQDTDETEDADAVADTYAFERTHRHLRTTARCEVDRPLTTSVAHFAGDTVARSLNPSTFEYTIRRHLGAVRQDALDMGGFAQVPLLLYDRAGNCFTVHRRLSLN